MFIKTYPKMLCVLLSSSFIAVSSSSYALTLNESVQVALEENPQVLQVTNEAKEANKNIRQAKGEYLPRLDLTASTGREHTDNATTEANFGDDRGFWRSETRLALTQLLFDGGRVGSNVDQQEAIWGATLSRLNEVEQNISFRAIQAYLDVLRRQELLSLAEVNVENHQKYFDKIGEQAEGGQASKADLRQTAGRLALAQSSLIDFRRQLQNAEAQFLEVVGVEPVGLETPTYVTEADIPQSRADAIATAMDENPAILAQKFNITAAKEAVANGRSAFYPRFDVEVSAGAGDNIDGAEGRNNEVLALVRMNYNLYAGGSDLARVQSRKARQSAAAARLDDLRRDVTQQVAEAWNNLQNTRDSLEHLGKYVIAATQTRDAYIDQFDLGMRTQFDLLDSEIETFNSNVELTNARYDYQLSKYEILSLIGGLSQSFK